MIMAGETKSSVLIVEDDEFISMIYEKKLSMEGYDVRVAKNGEEALSMMREREPDLAFLDILMPVKDGLETLREMRADTKLRGIKVVMLSNLSQDEEKNWAKSLGAMDYLVKSNLSVQDLAKKAREYIAGASVVSN